MLCEVEDVGAILPMGIPARIFYIAMRLSPPSIRSRMWKALYQKMANSESDSEFRFMNYGFIDECPIKLEESDEPDRMFIQLYHMNVRDIELFDKDVLEIGSGRGGGASWIAKSMNPKSLVAIDYSGHAIKLCKDWYAEQENLTFIEGNAEKIPLESESFDIVYNVESSHCYANVPAFLKEASRVLKPGGFFCWTDIRDRETMSEMEKQFLDSGFKIESKEEITDNVVAALRKIEKGRRKQIQDKAPTFLRKSFETFGGVPVTPVFESFNNGKLNYFRYLLSKRES